MLPVLPIFADTSWQAGDELLVAYHPSKAAGCVKKGADAMEDNVFSCQAG